MEYTKVSFIFGNVYFYDDFLCLEVKESQNFTSEMFDEIVTYKISLFPSKKIGYLSNRKNSFSFDPTLFFERKEVIYQHFNKLAIISDREWDYIEAEYISKICPVPSKYFLSFEEGKNWLKTP